MNGTEHPGVPKGSHTPAGAPPTQPGAQEITVDVPGAGPAGGPARLATVLISPTRFYVDLRNPGLLRDAILLAPGHGSAAARRNSLHVMFERWMMVASGGVPVEPANDSPPAEPKGVIASEDS